MDKSMKELIYEVENELLQELSPWEQDGVETRMQILFCRDGITTMANALIKKLEGKVDV